MAWLMHVYCSGCPSPCPAVQLDVDSFQKMRIKNPKLAELILGVNKIIVYCKKRKRYSFKTLSDIAV
jgi:hypothetical protein